MIGRRNLENVVSRDLVIQRGKQAQAPVCCGIPYRYHMEHVFLVSSCDEEFHHGILSYILVAACYLRKGEF